MTKLGEICKFQSGGTPSRKNIDYFNGEIPWVTTVALNGGLVSEKNAIDWITEKAICESAAKIVPLHSIMVGTRVGIGKVAINAVPMSTSQDIISLIGIDEEKYDKRYLCKFIEGKQNYLNAKAQGATIKGIKIDMLASLEFPSLSIDKQQHIAAVLDKISELIDLRKQQLAKLDELVKSRFVEMFGDAVHNDKGWETDTVEKLCEEIYGGGTPSKSHPEYYEDGNIPWVTSKDMKADVISDSQIKINQLGIDNSTAKMVPVNSVIMVIRSGILKHTLPVAINAVPVTVNQDLKAFIPSKRILTRFLAVQFKMHEKDILTGVRAVTADNIEFNSLKQRDLIVPPIELQQEYVAFLEQLDKSKAVVQQSLDKLETLKKSLMQEYFG